MLAADATGRVSRAIRQFEVSLPVPGVGDVEVFCQASGSGEPAFLCLHGFTFNSSSWRDVLPALGRLGRAVAYDRLPFGRSRKLLPGDWTGPNPYSHDAALDQVFGIMDALGLERAILLGNSAGGLLAARAALARPERVRALVLVCPAILTGPGDRQAAMTRWPLMERLGPVIAGRIGRNEWLLRRSFSDPTRVSAGRLARTAAMTRYPGWARALWAYRGESTAQPDIREDLGRLGQPVLIVSGANDRVVPADDGQRLARLLADAELAKLGQVGHVPQEEAPDCFMAVVEPWLRRRGLLD
jgi:pimeloyl-ACP methyl ester carboxylesterase